MKQNPAFHLSSLEYGEVSKGILCLYFVTHIAYLKILQINIIILMGHPFFVQ